MKTLNTAKTKAMKIFHAIASQHEEIVENGSTNTVVYTRMNRLLPILRNACYELAKIEPLTAQALFETAENMLIESYAYILNNVKLAEEEAKDRDWLNSVDEEMFDCNDDGFEDYRINGNFEEPSFPCNDEFGDLEGHTFDTKYCKQPILWKYNGKILNTTDLDDLPF